MLQVYIKTRKNEIIEINPKLKVPRTYKRFAALIAQLLEKLKVRAQNTSETLLKVVKGPITDYFPPNSLIIGTSTKGRMVKANEFIEKITTDRNEPIVLVVGAVSKGNPGQENDYVNDCICISRYPLSASNCLFKIVEGFEQVWKVE